MQTISCKNCHKAFSARIEHEYCRKCHKEIHGESRPIHGRAVLRGGYRRPKYRRRAAKGKGMTPSTPKPQRKTRQDRVEY